MGRIKQRNKTTTLADLDALVVQKNTPDEDMYIEGADLRNNIVNATTLGNNIANATTKNNLHDNDLFGLVDSQAGNTLKKTTWGNKKNLIKSFLEPFYRAIVPANNTETVFSTRSLQSTAPLGDELVQNGTFETDSNWTWGTGWAHNDSTKAADHTAGNTDSLTQEISVTNNSTYYIKFEIKNRTAGSITLDVNGVYITNSGATNNFINNEVYERTFVANTTGSAVLSITPDSNFNGSIDNVSVKVNTEISQPNIILRDDVNNVFAEIRGKASLSSLAIGLNALRNNISGKYNLALGYNSLYSNTTGYNNLALGNNSLYSNITGYHNSALGNNSLRFNTTGFSNSALGYNSLYFNTTGSYNSAFGTDSLRLNTTGEGNLALGVSAGYNITTGSYNIFIGLNSGSNSNQKIDVVNSISIGANVYTNANYQVVIGLNTSQHGLGIVPILTGSGLHINGTTIRIANRTISSSDATGEAGEMCADNNYLYRCVATNTWRRIAFTTW